jgi:hypothetical protein
MTSRGLALGIGLGLLTGLASNPTSAQEPTSTDVARSVMVTGDCPSQEAIWSDIRAIVAPSDLGKVTAARVEVSDLGATYHVRIVGDSGERQRTFRDVGRDCDHRARFAAVFIVVTLLPPDVLLESPPEPPPAPAPRPLPTPAVAVVAVSPAPSSPRTKRLRLELSALFDAAPAVAGSGPSTTLGGELRGLWGARRFVAVAALGFEPRASFDFGGVGVDELRVPFDVGAAWVHAWNRIAFAGEVGLAGAVVRISGTNTAIPSSGTRIDLGGRLGAAVRFGSSSSAVAPVLGIHALIFPKPYQATTTPQGDLGQLPALWLGLTAGVSFAP